MDIKRAIITAAGKSQRTLPLQTLVDRDGQTKTALAIIIEEVLAAGIEELCVVVCPGDEKAYRTAAGEHAKRLEFVEQKQPLGYGHAVSCAAKFTGKKPFLLLVGDHLYVSGETRRCAQQLVEVAAKEDCAVSAVQATHESKLPFYGAVGGKLVDASRRLYQVDTVLEKPTPTEAEQLIKRVRNSALKCAERALEQLRSEHPIRVIALREPPLPASPATVAEVHASHHLLSRADSMIYHDALVGAAESLGIPVVHGSIFRFEGMVSVFHPKEGPTYRDIFWQRIRFGTFDKRDMPNHAFLAILTENQLHDQASEPSVVSTTSSPSNANPLPAPTMKFGNKALAIALLFVGLVLVNYLASSLPVRVDATAESIYSLSDGTRKMLGKIEEPVTVDLYFSKDASGLPIAYKNYAARVQEMLRHYIAHQRDVIVRRHGLVAFEPIVRSAMAQPNVLVKALPKMAKGAESPKLKKGFEKHLAQPHTRQFREKLQPLLGGPLDERLHVLFP